MTHTLCNITRYNRLWKDKIYLSRWYALPICARTHAHSGWMILK